METNTYATLEGIEELCQLLKGDDGPSTSWYKNLTKSIHDVDLFTALEFAEEKERNSVNTPVLPQLFHVLREFLLNHRWTEALEVLKTVASVPSGTSQTVWKVGVELFSMEVEVNRDLIQQLFSQMRAISDLNGKQVVMEFVTYLLGIGDDVEAATVIQEAVKRHGRKKEVGYREEYIDKLHKAYIGLLWYLEWQKCKKKYEELEIQQSQTQENECLSQNPMQTEMQSLTMQIRNFSDRAMSCFTEVEGLEGIWDIFVTKHAELLISIGQQKSALQVFKSYCESNADNLNAHKYLYSFYKEHQPNHVEEIKTLKVIAQLSPSDEMVLDLCSKLTKAGDVPTCVQYLFSLLDYSCWQMEDKPWKMLARCLRKLDKGSSGNMKVVGSCWNPRKSWWPAYHFTKQNAMGCRPDKGLLYHKAVVASFLCGKDTEFVTEARPYLTEAEIKTFP